MQTMMNYKLYQGDVYRKFRPHYPFGLIEYIYRLCTEREIAWDCCTGTGSLAAMLAPYFQKIIATDLSKSQIASAEKKTNVEYHVGDIYSADIAPSSIDLITVGQAYHWLDPVLFYKKSNSVLKSKGIIAITCYSGCTNQAVEKIAKKYERIVDENYMPQQEKLIHSGYADISIPFPKLGHDIFIMRERWNMDYFIGYLSSMSMTTFYKEKYHRDPIEGVYADIQELWGHAENRIDIEWKLHLHTYRKS